MTKQFIVLLLFILLFNIRVEAQKSVIYLTQNNYGYLGIPTQLKLVKCVNSDIDLKIITNNGRIISTGKYTYDHVADSVGKATIVVTGKKGDIKETLDSLNLNIKPIPLPEFSVCGLRRGKIQKDILTKAYGAVIFLPDLMIDVQYNLNNYTLQILRGSEVLSIIQVEHENDNSKQELVSSFERLRDGDILLFYNINASVFSVKDILLTPVQLTVKDS